MPVVIVPHRGGPRCVRVATGLCSTHSRCSTGRRASLLREALTAGMEAVYDTPYVLALVQPLLADIVWRHAWSMAVVVNTLDVDVRAGSIARTDCVMQLLPQCVVCYCVKH